jgi:hypothetical protein
MAIPTPTTALDEAQARPRTPGEARLALLRERGICLTNIARDLDRDLSTVSRVNRGQRRSELIEREIAHRLDLSMPDAFPEWHRAPA